MAAVVQGVDEVRTLIGHSPVVVGGLAVMCRLSDPYRATTDLDLSTGCSARHRSFRYSALLQGRSLWRRPPLGASPAALGNHLPAAQVTAGQK